MEYSFGEGAGISEGIPKDVIGAQFRESILLGETYKTNDEITRTIDALRSRYKGNEYNMILKYALRLIRVGIGTATTSRMT